MPDLSSYIIPLSWQESQLFLFTDWDCFQNNWIDNGYQKAHNMPFTAVWSKHILAVIRRKQVIHADPEHPKQAIFQSSDKQGCQQWRILDSDEEDKIPAVYTLKVVKVGSPA